MRNLSIAVAGILASAAASAATHDLYIGGASAQKAFWKADMVTSVCGANAQTTYTIGGATIDNEAWRCTAGIGTISGIAIGDTVTVHYNSQLGTVSGVAPLVYGLSIAPRLFVNPDSLDCSGTVCTVTSYDEHNETFTSTNGTAMVVDPNGAQFDIGVLDMEIKHWAVSQNWPSSAYAVGFGSVPSATALAAVTGGKVMNGQVFSVLVNNSGPAAAKGNLSKASLMAIMTGQYDVWGDVPEVGGGNTTAIKLCRRDAGSGTQVAASVFFTGLECGYSSTSFASVASPVSLTSVSEEVSTPNVRTCVQGTTGAIGVTSLSTNTAWTTLNIDGVQANAHNAAAGSYGFAFEDWVYDKTATSGATTAMKNLANAFITNARKAASLTSQIESTAVQGANGIWTATARKSNYAVPGGGFGNTKSVLSAASTTQAVTALGYRAGDNCKVLFNSNTL